LHSKAKNKTGVVVRSAVSASRTSRVKKLRILVVDDFSPFREALCSFLLGYAPLTVVGEAADGDEAIELALRLAPHVIIMDVRMPRKSGLEATQRIKQALPEVHVIGVSTQNDTFLKSSMEAAGFSTFITKDCAHTLPDVIATITGRSITKDYPLAGTA
jgi:DNA-binding NarL/FixJ family response regulator